MILTELHRYASENQYTILESTSPCIYISRFRDFQSRTLSLVHTTDSVDDFSPPGKCDRMNDMQKTLELFTSEKRLYTFVREFTHLHPSETQNRQCEPGFTNKDLTI
jgi:hypothetical protein